MAQVWVNVERSDGSGVGDNFYVEGNYVQPAGTLGAPAKSDSGSVKFETLDAAGDPEWRARANVIANPGNSENNPLPVTLQLIATV